MKRLVLTVLLVSGLASAASAQVGKLGVYADATGLDCNVIDSGAPAVRSAYVVHKFDPGNSANGCRFKFVTSGVTMTYLGYSTPFASLGAPDTGIAIAFGACRNDAVLQILKLDWLGFGANPACGTIELAADPFTTQQAVIATSCDFVETVMPTPGKARVNPDANCTCDIPVAESTWGGVKALYR